MWVVRRADARIERHRRADPRRGARLRQRRGADLGSAGGHADRDRRRAEDGTRIARRAAARRPRSLTPDEILQPHRMGARPSSDRRVPDARDRHRRHARVRPARSTRRSELLGAVDDGDGLLAGRIGAADPGRSAQPDGEEVRAARSLREGRHVRAPGLRRHDAERVGRHVESGSARGLVSGAQEVQRHRARAARGRHRADLQRRVRRRRGDHVCGQSRWHRAGRAIGRARKSSSAGC